jgi:hypothetical protein
MSDRLLRLYPAGYRAAYGQEILGVHREMTMDLPWTARVRADADLVAHALRVRLGLDPVSTGGRFFALTTPFALAVAAAYGGIRLMNWYAGVAISPGSTWSQVVTIDAREAINVLFLALTCVGAIIALIRRSNAIAAVLGLLGLAAQWTVTPSLYDGPSESIAAVVTAAVLLACPPDRRSDRRLSIVAAAMAAVAWFPVALVKTRGFIVSTDYGAWPLLTLAVTGVGFALLTRSATKLAAMAAASPLFLSLASTGGLFVWG